MRPMLLREASLVAVDRLWALVKCYTDIVKGPVQPREDDAVRWVCGRQALSWDPIKQRIGSCL